MIKSLNIGNLKDAMAEQRNKGLNELTPSGSYWSLYLLIVQRFLHEMINFTMIPCVFELTYHLQDRKPLNAALVLAMTPLSTALISIIMNMWVDTDFQTPMVLGQVMFFLSSLLYYYSYETQSLRILLISRFMFGMAGT